MYNNPDPINTVIKQFWKEVLFGVILVLFCLLNSGCRNIYPRCGYLTAASIREQQTTPVPGTAGSTDSVALSIEPDGNGGFKAKAGYDLLKLLEEKEEENLPWVGASLGAFLGDLLIYAGTIYGGIETYQHYSEKGDDSQPSVPEGFNGIWVGGDASGKFDTLDKPIVVQGNAEGVYNTGGPVPPSGE